MTKVEYVGDWPADVRLTVEGAVGRWLYLIPGWCRSIHIRFENDGGENQAAAVSVDYEGRHAVMYIRPGWFQESPADREKAIIHEIAHLHVQPIRSVFVDVINKGIEDQGFKDFAWERFKEAWEGSVEDLAWALYEAGAAK